MEICRLGESDGVRAAGHHGSSAFTILGEASIDVYHIIICSIRTDAQISSIRLHFKEHRPVIAGRDVFTQSQGNAEPEVLGPIAKTAILQMYTLFTTRLRSGVNSNNIPNSTNIGQIAGNPVTVLLCGTKIHSPYVFNGIISSESPPRERKEQ